MKTSNDHGKSWPDVKIIPSVMAAAPAGATAKSSRLNLLFPDGSGEIINVYGAGSCSGPCTNLIIYLEHNELSTKRGKVTYSALSGRVMSEIVNYP